MTLSLVSAVISIFMIVILYIFSVYYLVEWWEEERQLSEGEGK